MAVSVSEMTRLIEEFDKSMDTANNKRLREETSYHEQLHNRPIQKVFAQHVSALTDVFEEL